MDLDLIAREMQAAQQRAQSIEPFTQRVPRFDSAAAYEVSHRLHEFRLRAGWRPIGRKIGSTTIQGIGLPGLTVTFVT